MKIMTHPVVEAGIDDVLLMDVCHSQNRAHIAATAIVINNVAGRLHTCTTPAQSEHIITQALHTQQVTRLSQIH